MSARGCSSEMSPHDELSEKIATNLYSDVRISYALEQAHSLAHGRQLQPADLHHLDLLHYCGMGSVEAFLRQHTEPLSPRPIRVLDIGSGLGGPARFIAENFTTATVTGVEYQKEQAEVSTILNRLCGLDRIKIVCDDFVTMGVNSLPRQDLLLSQLCFLHIADKARLFTQCRKALKTGGFLFVEDFFLLQPLDQDENDLLQKDVAVPDKTLMNQNDYIRNLSNAKIKVDSWTDMTDEWSRFVWDRCESFLQDGDSLSTQYADLFAQTTHFYTQVARVFHSNIISSDYPLTTIFVGQEWLSRPQRLGGVGFIGVAC